MAEYKTYLFDCACPTRGILFKNNIPCCRMCRKPLGQGGMMNYDDSHFPKEVTPSGEREYDD